MPIIKPFCAVRYNPAKVDLNAVVAPPYDVISIEQQNELYDRHPCNVVRLILGREPNRYTSAAKTYEDWFKKGILLQEPKPAIYYLTQTFAVGGNKFQRKGVILRCKLEDFDKRIVLPHERTHSKPKEDRLKLLQLTKANFSQIFSFYSDPEGTVDAILEPYLHTVPFMQVAFEDVQNTVWNITESGAVQAITMWFRDKQAFIADGHHRYETGLLYRDMLKHRSPHHTGEESYNHIAMCLTNMDEPGLVSLATHRLVYGVKDFERESFYKQLNDDFITETCGDFATLQRLLVQAHQHSLGMIVHGDSNFYLVRVRNGTQIEELVGRKIPEVLAELDVTLLHEVILEKLLNITPEAQLRQTNLRYMHDAEEVLRAVRVGNAQVGFLMNPTRIEQVRSVAIAGHVLPQKSTFFYPKLISGLLIHRFDD